MVPEDGGREVTQDLLPHPLALSKVLSWPLTRKAETLVPGQWLLHIGPGLGFRSLPSLSRNKLVLTQPALLSSSLKII